jgi:hypothetical protein
LGFGRLLETFRFISVTRSRTVSRTSWTGDQLVARPLLTAPGDCDDDGEIVGMNGSGRGKPRTPEFSKSIRIKLRESPRHLKSTVVQFKWRSLRTVSRRLPRDPDINSRLSDE